MNFIQPKCKLISLLLSVTGLLSCSRGAMDHDVTENKIPLEFTTSVDWDVKSKALINSTEDLQSCPVSILANAAVGENVYSTFQNDKLFYENGAWTYGPTKYWIYEAKYFFAAFAPFASGDAANKLSNGSVSFSDYDNNPVLAISGYNTIQRNPNDSRTEDLLVAHSVRDNTSSDDYSTVALDFKHILSSVSFRIRNTTNNNIVEIRDIKLSGLLYKCDIVLNTSSVAMQISDETGQAVSADRIGTSQNPFLPKGMSEADYKLLFDCEILTLLPQTLYENDDIKLTFKVHTASNTNGTDYMLKLGNIETLRKWEAGKKYDYSISITSTDILFQVSEVPWIEHDVEL